MMFFNFRRFLILAAACGSTAALAAVGDPQIRTDHPWYPGELAASTFERLFATQAEQYERATGKKVKTDEDRALAAWFWRNTHYAHGEEGAENLWGTGFTKGDLRTREYWTGLFAHGFGLCGTTHSQWTAEMEQLLGHGRGRGVGVAAHNSFEVWLTGGNYGTGRWALLDHDISTVIYNLSGTRLLSLPEVQSDYKNLTHRQFKPERQNGWLVCGLHPDDGSVYKTYATAEYLAGYSGPPPMVYLRRGETLRRYLKPGLEDGNTFVFWGRNYNAGGVPGPERSLTWVNQPEKMFQSKTGTPFRSGQARYGNAVYSYAPNFRNGEYREGIVDEDAGQVTFEFQTPYIIAATPPNAKEWGIYDAGCTNGLVLRGKATCTVSVSVDRGGTWSPPAPFRDGLDLTDAVKGFRQYWLRFHAPATELTNADIGIRTVCQANAALMPRLKDDGSLVTFAASGRAVVSAGPTKTQAARHIVAGAFDSPTVTMQVASPRGERMLQVFAAAHVASGNPPDRSTRYQIEYSSDAGATWHPLVKDWRIERRGEEPADFWSQSFCYGSIALPQPAASVQVRFNNSGRRKYLRAEVHAVYAVSPADSTQVTFDWVDTTGPRRVSKLFERDGTWNIATAGAVETRWVEMAPISKR